MLFRDYRIEYNLDRYMLAKETYQEWRDRFIADSELNRKKQNDGMRDARRNMRSALNNLVYLGVARDTWERTKKGVEFKVYSDPKCSVERKVWVKS